MALKGLDNVLGNLNREVAGIEDRTRRGMQKVGLFVKGEAQEITPVEFGVLLNSSFYSTDEGNGDGPRVRIGYTAQYAPYVHEMPNGTNWSKPGTGNKFLEKPIREEQSTILEIIRDEAEIK